MAVYLCIGDSITKGSGFPASSWVSLLAENKENQQDENNLVYNLGIASDTTENLLSRMDIEMSSRKKSYLDTISILAIGINDSKYHRDSDTQEVELEKFKENYKLILKKVENLSDKVYVLGLTRVNEDLMNPSPYDDVSFLNSKIDEYDAIIKSLCKDMGVQYISMMDVIENNDLIDGIHPNDKGYAKMYNNINKFL